MQKYTLGALILVLLLTAVGCSSTPPDKIATEFLEAVSKADYEAMAKVIKGADADIFEIPEEDGGEEIVKAILGRVTYQLGQKSVSGTTATVSAKITAPDLLRITGKVLPEIMGLAFTMAFSNEGSSQEEMDALFVQYFENAIKDPEAPMVESSINIQLEKVDGGWVIVPDDDLANALTGNMAKAFAEIGD